MMVGLAATLYGQCPFISAVNIIDEDGCGGPARIEVIARYIRLKYRISIENAALTKRLQLMNVASY